jgi:hypothetical protein
MLKNMLILAASLILGSTALADDGHQHTPSVCSKDNASVCAHLGLPKTLNSHDEGRFMAHVETPQDAAVSNMKIDLWMDMGGGHGHSSSPVDIKDAGYNHFMVTNAWFVMEGTWLVRMDFDFEGAHYHLEVPVTVAQ